MEELTDHVPPISRLVRTDPVGRIARVGPTSLWTPETAREEGKETTACPEFQSTSSQPPS